MYRHFRKVPTEGRGRRHAAERQRCKQWTGVALIHGRQHRDFPLSNSTHHALPANILAAVDQVVWAEDPWMPPSFAQFLTSFPGFFICIAALLPPRGFVYAVPPQRCLASLGWHRTPSSRFSYIIFFKEKQPSVILPPPFLISLSRSLIQV